MQNAAIEMHWLMVNHVSRLKKAEKPKMLVWRTEFGRGVFFGGKLNKPCGYWFCQKWLLIISKRPKKSSEWCYFNLTPPTDHGTILRRSPHQRRGIPPPGQNPGLIWSRLWLPAPQIDGPDEPEVFNPGSRKMVKVVLARLSLRLHESGRPHQPFGGETGEVHKQNPRAHRIWPGVKRANKT